MITRVLSSQDHVTYSFGPMPAQTRYLCVHTNQQELVAVEPPKKTAIVPP